MADEESNKHFIIDISSSDESKSPLLESDDDAVEEISSSRSCYDDEWSEWSPSEDEDEVEVGGDEDWDIDDVDKPDAESMCDKVIQFIRGRSDLQELKVAECKAYLRRHNLRLSGTREECMERIKEHWKLKNGNGEVFYPRSSFIVDCTGDVCKGDIVLFHQNVHQISGTMARNKTVGRRNVGRRTVAGRIIKESYGATRQQHTFTVEVLWSRGTKKLQPLFPLLVKGRNLYKMKTFRQLWKNEKERTEVLAEKHRRGNAARTVRAMRRESVMRKNEPSTSAIKGPSRRRETSPGKKTCPNERGKLAKNKKRIQTQRFAPYSSKQNAGSRGSAPYRRDYNSPYHVRQSPSLSFNYPAQIFTPTSSQMFPSQNTLNFHSHGGFASIDGATYSIPFPHSSTRPSSESSHGSSRRYSRSKNENEAVRFNYFRSRSSHRPSYSTSERHKMA